MATVITSIGSKGTTGDPVDGPLTINTQNGSGTPWTGTVTFNSAPTANIGDKLYFENVYYTPSMGGGCSGGGTANVIYLITGVSGSTLTVKYISGASSTTAPMDIKSDSFCSTVAQPYVVRFYSTIATWESGCDETSLYSSGDTAQGECYADSALSVTSRILFNSGHVTDIGKQVLTVPVGQRHDGTADSGFKVNVGSISSDAGSPFHMFYYSNTPMNRIIEWIEIDGGDTDKVWGHWWSIIKIQCGGAYAYAATVSHTLIHGCHCIQEGSGNSYGMIGGVQAYSYIHNNIVYDCSGRKRTPGIGIGSGIMTNNTVYKIGMTDDYGGTTSNEAIGITSGNSINTNKNNIAIGTYVEDPSGDGEKYDYFTTGTGTVGTYNISGDSTASGSDSLTSITAASIFISTTTGSEDLHILRSSKAVGAGADLGTGVSYNAGYGNDTAAGGSDYGTPLNRDINNGDRNAFAMLWDIGASQNSIIATIGTALGSVGNGTVTLTSGSTSVTGVNTNFTSAFTGATAPPQSIEIPSGGGTTYTVKSVESDTELTLASDPGVSAGSQSWRVGTRDFSTVAAWTALLDDDDYYGAGSVARGECYADSAFTACYLENGFTIGLTQLVLTAADGQQHDGTAGSGVVFNMSTTAKREGGPGGSAYISYGIFSFLEFTQSGTMNDHYVAVGGWGGSGQMEVNHCLIHGYDFTKANNAVQYLLDATGISNGDSTSYHNNILYDFTRSVVGSSNCILYGIYMTNAYGALTNNTVYNIHADSTDGSITQSAVGIRWQGQSGAVKNNIAIGLSSANGTTTSMVCTGGSPTRANNNMVQDTAAGAGSSSQTDKSSSGQFVSTTTGSEDLHLVLGSDAIGNGEDLGLSTSSVGWGSNDVGQSYYVLGQNYDINGGNRDAFSQTWDIGASQYAIIATIGTNSRDYSTFNVWEADLDDTSYYGKGSVANGQMYKDSDYQWNGHFFLTEGAGLAAATYLTVAEGQRHDGTPNTGVRFLNNGTYQYNGMVFQLHYVSGKPCKRSLEWVEMDENGKGGGGHTSALIHSAGGWGQISIGSFNHCMVYNYYLGNILAGDHTGVIHFNSQYGQAHNNLLFNIKAGNPSGGSPFLGNLFGITTDRTCVITNNTVYGLKHVDSTSGEAMGYKDSAYTTQEIYNNICVGNETQDFHDWDGATHSHNLSSDSSATGTGSVTGKSAASLFVSTTTGSEDLHLINGAAALGAGKDLGTKVTAWSADFGGEGTCMTHLNFDIDGENRNDADDWSIGADQCDSCSKGGATGSPSFLLFLDN